MLKSSDEGALLGVIGQVYDAAVEPARWTGVLADITVVLGSCGVNLFAADARPDRIRFCWTTGMSESSLREYSEYYAAKNAWYLEVYRRRLPAGQHLLSNEWFPDDALERTEIYNDFLRPQDFHHYCGGAIRYDGPEMSVFNAFRPKNMKPFESRHVEFCGRLAPHLSRALDIQRRFAELKSLQSATLEALDHLPMGVMLFDRDGHVSFMNKSAGEIVATNDGLGVGRAGTCRAARKAETDRLQMLIRGAAKTGSGKGFGTGGAISLLRPSGLRPLTGLVAPLGKTTFNFGSQSPAAVFFISDPERRHEPPGKLLSRLFGLTPMEARVAVAMLSGRSLTSVAETLGVTRNTARSHLQQVYLKTTTKRQSELVKLLLTGPAGLEFPQGD